MVGCVIAVATPWDWTEVIEGIAVSLAVVLAPILWRVEKHRKTAERHHAEQQTHNQRVREHLGMNEP